MDIERLIEELKTEDSRNDAINFLASTTVDTNERLIECLAELINKPEGIRDTNQFASLLTELPSEKYITPLINAISIADIDKTMYLADYMYALGELLDERANYWEPEEKFIHTLGGWLLGTGGGEISWKAGIILARLKHPAVKKYYIEGALDRSLLFLTRYKCIDGLLQQYSECAEDVICVLLKDTDENIRKYAEKAMAWLKNHVIDNNVE